MVKFGTNASGTIRWPKLQLVCKCCHVVAELILSHRVNYWVRCASGNVFYQFFQNKKIVSNKTSRPVFNIICFAPCSNMNDNRVKKAAFVSLENILVVSNLLARMVRVVSEHWSLFVLKWQLLTQQCSE